MQNKTRTGIAPVTIRRNCRAWILPAAQLLLLLLLLPPAVGCEEADNARMAQLIYQNECASNPQNLTSWNKGEAFASLGIGHFIWYPEGNQSHPFEETFPALLRFFRQHQQALPEWLRESEVRNPWQNRQHFQRSLNSVKMIQLRKLLQQTKILQFHFIRQRLEAALPLMLEGLPVIEQQLVQRNFFRMVNAPMGYFALIDYVNFKGEGVRLSERYQGEGWGLLQVLQHMPTSEPGVATVDAFAVAARRQLQRRVQHSPPARHEARWLPGWQARIQRYSQLARAAKGSSR